MQNCITVVTSCTGSRDVLSDDQVTEGAKFIAYVDQLADRSIWEQRLACQIHSSPRRNSRIHKLLIHQYVDSEYSLWMDANMRLLVPARRLVEEWLAGHDIAIFRHRVRNCIYEEAEICAALQLDNPGVINEQVSRYLGKGFPTQQGLAEACVILRRHTRAVEDFNNAWWSEYCRYSVRDQISLMYAANRTSVRLNLITPTRFDNPYFSSLMRPPGVEHEVELPGNVLEIC